MSGIIGQDMRGRSGVVGEFPGPPGNASGTAYGGHILQMVMASESAESNNSASTSFAVFTNSMQVVIYPASTSNKFLIQWCARLYSSVTFAIDFYRSISGGASTANLSGEANGLGTEPPGDQTHSYWILDSPATTSAVTYRPSAKSASASNVVMGDTDRLTQIIAFEIQG